ncbi:MAG TPA: lysylphosphatidylglycerol synthase transmembrane domain-containing protein [Rhodocyclaceae bacterium]|nr:lysylphosphatidylglycerol synthase transmembrane domain-containing protein [Rhodocyclaceae bacterium]
MRKASIRIAASLLLVALVFYFADPPRVLRSLGHTEPGWLAVGFASAVVASLLSALRWRAIARWLGLTAATPGVLRAYWQGITANTVLPGGHLGGDALRVLHLQQAGNSLIPAAASVALDRFSGLWMLTVLSLAASTAALGLLPAGYLPRSEILALLTLGALIAPWLLWQFSAVLQRWLPRKIANLLDILHGRPHGARLYWQQMFWSAGVQVFSVLAYALGGKAVGLDLPFDLFLVAAGPVFILAAVPLSVGGWGTREAASALVLGALGAPKEQAVAAAVLYGLFAALQGLLGAGTLINWKRRPSP